MNVGKVFNHPLTVPVLAAASGLANGILIGLALGRREALVELIEEVEAELDANPDQFVLEFNKEEADVAVVLPFDKEEASLLTDEQAEAMGLTGSMREIVEQRLAMPGGADRLLESLINDPITEEEVTNVYPEYSNVFSDNYGVWDYETEHAQRTEEAPYVIHADEFAANEKKYHQQSLIWYEGDEIMTDEDNNPFMRHGEYLGELKFGHGSRSEDVVFIRNDKMEGEYEVVRNYSSYAKEVLGVEAEEQYEQEEIRHSQQPMRLRNYD